MSVISKDQALDLSCVIGMYRWKFFTLESSSYIVTFYTWIGTANCYGVLLYYTRFVHSGCIGGFMIGGYDNAVLEVIL
jgi:hypothetical protein